MDCIFLQGLTFNLFLDPSSVQEKVQIVEKWILVNK